MFRNIALLTHFLRQRFFSIPNSDSEFALSMCACVRTFVRSCIRFVPFCAPLCRYCYRANLTSATRDNFCRADRRAVLVENVPVCACAFSFSRLRRRTSSMRRRSRSTSFFCSDGLVSSSQFSSSSGPGFKPPSSPSHPHTPSLNYDVYSVFVIGFSVRALRFRPRAIFEFLSSLGLSPSYAFPPKLRRVFGGVRGGSRHFFISFLFLYSRFRTNNGIFIFLMSKSMAAEVLEITSETVEPASCFAIDGRESRARSLILILRMAVFSRFSISRSS